MRWLVGLLTCSALALGGCVFDLAPSTSKSLRAVVYGEEFIEDEIPPDETDGWTITFDRFLIVISDLRVLRSGALLGEANDARVFDLAQPSLGAGSLVDELLIDAEDGLHEIQYRVSPADAAAPASASSADAAFMSDSGFSVYVEIVATNGDETKTLAYGSAGSTTYAGCFTTLDFDDAGSARVELTIHGDHLFYEDLSEDPAVRFGAIAAADADDDGEITESELADAGLDASTGASDLADLIETLIATLGHIDGEGHCADVSVE